MYVCTRLFFFFIDCPPSRPSSCILSQIIPVLSIRAWHRQQAHCTAQSNQLCASSSWHCQIASCTKPWAYFCPLNMLLYSSLRERSGRCQLPAERSSYIINNNRFMWIHPGVCALEPRPTTQVLSQPPAISNRYA